METDNKPAAGAAVQNEERQRRAVAKRREREMNYQSYTDGRGRPVFSRNVEMGMKRPGHDFPPGSRKPQ